MNWTGVSIIFLLFLLMQSKAQDAVNNAEAAKPFEIPNHLWPDSYNVQITVNLEENDFSFYGFSEITVTCKQATKAIIVNVKDLVIDDTKIVVTQKETELAIADRKPDAANQLYIITMEQDLVEGQSYVVHIPFSGVLEEKLSGLYRSSYFNPDTHTFSWIAVTQAEPNYLRSVMPCMDELKFKSIYTLSIGHHNRFTALSNTPVAQSANIDGQDNYVMDTFKPTQLLSSYLVGFVIVDYEKSEMYPPNSNFPITVWARKQALPMTQWGHEVTLKAYELWTNYFGVSLEIEKLDLVVIYDYAMGGMENSGLTTLGEWDMLYQDNVSYEFNKVNTAKLAAHEMCHSWMGNLASFRAWRSDWVKEGFANYLEKVAVSRLYDDLKIWEPEWSLAFNDALAVDGQLGSRKLAYNAQNPIDPTFLFDTITYQKGSLLIQMLSFVMGDDSFETAVSTFVQTFKDGVAEMEDVWQIFTDVAVECNVYLPPNTSVGDIMSTWTEQRGYPKLILTRDVANKKIIIEQMPFDFDATSENDKRCWWMPISFITKSAPKVESVAPAYWLGCEGPIEITDVQLAEQDWVIVSPRLTNLCRIKYDDATLKLISQTLTNKDTYLEIEVLSRVQFLADLHGLAWTGEIEYSVLFEGLKLLWHETEFAVWSMGLYIMGSIRYVLSITGLGYQFQLFAKTIVDPAFLNDPNMNEFNGDTNYIRKKALFLSWAHGYDAGDSRKQGTELFNKWKAEQDPDNNNPILAPARQAIYCIGGVGGGQEAFDFLFARFQNAIVPAERINLIFGMGCTQVNSIINTLLDWSIDPTKFRQNESIQVFYALSLDDVATNSLFGFFEIRFDKIFEFHKGNLMTMGRYLGYLFGRVTDEDRFNKFTAFLDTKKDKLAGLDLIMNQGISVAKDNIAFIKRHTDYLKKTLPQPPAAATETNNLSETSNLSLAGAGYQPT